jgi:hypothetical protein
VVTDDEFPRVIAECMMSPTGRTLVTRLASPGTEPGNVQYSPEALSILAAFVEAKWTIGDGIELDSPTLRWLR